MKDFKAQLASARITEIVFDGYFRANRWSTVPIYGIEKGSKGPRIGTPRGELVAPDLLICKNNKAAWIEAKGKSRFTWHRNTKTWQTGIDYRYYKDYLEIAKLTPFQVWLLFLHEKAEPSLDDLNNGSPASCPIGLFGIVLNERESKIHHRYPDYGNSGMVYWCVSDLEFIASLEEMKAQIAQWQRSIAKKKESANDFDQRQQLCADSGSGDL